MSNYSEGPFELISRQLGLGGSLRQMASPHTKDAATTGAGDKTTQEGGMAKRGGVETGAGSAQHDAGVEPKEAEAKEGEGIGGKVSSALHSLVGGAKTSLSSAAGMMTDTTGAHQPVGHPAVGPDALAAHRRPPAGV